MYDLRLLSEAQKKIQGQALFGFACPDVIFGRESHFEQQPCARTGFFRLAGPVQKILTDDHMYYNHLAIEFAFQEAMNLDIMAVVRFVGKCGICGKVMGID